MYNNKTVRATFKARNKRQLDYILEKLIRSFGKENVISLSPTFFFKAKIYILDVEIRIANTLLRYDFKGGHT